MVQCNEVLQAISNSGFAVSRLNVNPDTSRGYFQFEEHRVDFAFGLEAYVTSQGWGLPSMRLNSGREQVISLPGVVVAQPDLT